MALRIICGDRPDEVQASALHAAVRAGGPCIYDGRDMHTAHAKLPINNAHFNALTEDLYIAFDRVGVSYALQNQMIALLAPMQRDIVKR